LTAFYGVLSAVKNLRYILIAICAWFFFFYNIEKLFGIVNIATYVYVLVFVYAVLIILLRPLQRMPLYGLLFLSLVPYIILKIEAGRAITGIGLPIAVTEVCVIWITVVLIRQMACGLEGFRESITKLTIGHLEKETDPFDTGQSQIYHEIRRSRRYQRPATLLAIRASGHSVQISLDRFIKDAQHEIIDKYVNGRIAKFLSTELGDLNIILQRGDHFIILLPEANQEKAAEIMNQLRNAGQESLGLELQIGVATFPDEAVTFETLLQNAEEEMISAASADQNEMNLTSAQINSAMS
jgi:GGDEF domain-containing protein